MGKSLQDAIHLSGAHIVFKEHPPKPPPISVEEWSARNKKKDVVAPGVERPSVRSTIRPRPKQRIVRGIPRDPVDKTAALVTSRTPRGCENTEEEQS